MKVGIITFYNKSCNYGGLLQAYALCELISGFGFPAEQITFERNDNVENNKPCKKKCSLKNLPRWLKNQYIDFRSFLLRKKLRKRQEAFKSFRESIPHSEVFDSFSIHECNKIYDIFVTGSDQVWNPIYLKPEYLLTFVDKAPKIAYAVSISQPSLTKEQKEVFAKNIKDYVGVSVREEQTVNDLLDIYPKTKWVLDPTLLLGEEQWGRIVSKREVKDKYIFCYFIGLNREAREMAKLFAKKNKLKIVTIPYFNNAYTRVDDGFGDITPYDVSPNQWLSLIKHAEFVFTDSFHATVFSHIFKKQFFVFNRSSQGEMSNRIYSLLKLMGTEERFIDSNHKANLEYLSSLNPVDYSLNNSEFGNMRKSSRDYLEHHLKKAEEQVLKEAMHG